jgi:hypothetical protein
MLRRVVMCGIAIALLLAPLPGEVFTFLGTPAALAQEMYQNGISEETPSGESIIFDVILVRPGGIAAIAIGTAFFIVSLPFGIISGSTAQAGKALVADPFNFTFTRPLGEFSQYDPDRHQTGQ